MPPDAESPFDSTVESEPPPKGHADGAPGQILGRDSAGARTGPGYQLPAR